ncbi:hypothetical protein SEVIR_3G336432v4 [Setaria viridis]
MCRGMRQREHAPPVARAACTEEVFPAVEKNRDDTLPTVPSLSTAAAAQPSGLGTLEFVRSGQDQTRPSTFGAGESRSARPPGACSEPPTSDLVALATSQRLRGPPRDRAMTRSLGPGGDRESCRLLRAAPGGAFAKHLTTVPFFFFSL